MPLREKSVMEQRQEFVRLAGQDGVNRRELCRRFGISADTAYKWLGRWERGDAQLADRSRRPHHSPRRTEASVEALILAMRDAHPAWGARKIAHCLERDGVRCPTISTVHEVLRRRAERAVAPLWQRFFLAVRAREAAFEWMRAVLQKDINLDVLRREVGDIPDIETLLQHIYAGRLSHRNRSMTVLASRRGLSALLVCSFLGIDKKTHRKYLRTFEDGGCAALFARQTNSTRKFDDETIKQAVFGLLHETALKLRHQSHDMDHV